MAASGWNPSLLRRIIEEYAQPGQATKALTEFRAQGGSIRTQTWYRLWGEVENERNLAGIEEGKDLRFRPDRSDIIQWTVPRATGYRQLVNVFARTANGNVITKQINVNPNGPPKSRAWAIAQAERIAQGIESGEAANPDTEIIKVIGGVYVGTRELVNPEE